MRRFSGMILLASSLAFLATAGALLAVDLDGDGVLDTIRWSESGLILEGDTGWKIGPVPWEFAVRSMDARDQDGDGLVDILVVLMDGREHLLTPSLQLKAQLPTLTETWNSASLLGNVRTVSTGDYDGDGRAEILSVNWPNPTLRIFEARAINHFEIGFSTSPEDSPPGAFVTVTGGDTDGDGHQELIAGETSTLNQILLFEAVGDNEFVRRPIAISEPSSQRSMGDVEVGDLDADGFHEIVFTTYSSIGNGSKVFVYEQDGEVGINTYSKIFEYELGGYVYNLALGDSDNDGFSEIILGLGGLLAGFPLTVYRLESVGDNAFEQKSTQPGGNGLALTPLIADADGDGLNELIYASIDNGQSAVKVYDATGDDTYKLTSSVLAGSLGNGVSAAAGGDSCQGGAVINVGFFDFWVAGWCFNDKASPRIWSAPVAVSGRPRDLAAGYLDGDSSLDVVVASHAYADQVQVLEVVIFSDGFESGDTTLWSHE